MTDELYIGITAVIVVAALFILHAIVKAVYEYAARLEAWWQRRKDAGGEWWT